MFVLYTRSQTARIGGKCFRPIQADHIRIFDAHTPRASVQPAVAHCDDYVGWERGRCFLAVEEGVPWRQRGFLEFNPHPVDGRPEDMIAVPGIFKHPMDV